ncbi:MAG: hypothetical protein ACTHJS_08760 [Xanthobacteraceae bacterium]
MMLAKMADLPRDQSLRSGNSAINFVCVVVGHDAGDVGFDLVLAGSFPCASCSIERTIGFRRVRPFSLQSQNSAESVQAYRSDL